MYRQTKEVDLTTLEITNGLTKDFDCEVEDVFIEVVLTIDGKKHSRFIKISNATVLNKAKTFLLNRTEFKDSTLL